MQNISEDRISQKADLMSTS